MAKRKYEYNTMPKVIPWSAEETTALLALCVVSNTHCAFKYLAVAIVRKLNEQFPNRRDPFTRNSVIAKLSRINHAKRS